MSEVIYIFYHLVSGHFPIQSLAVKGQVSGGFFEGCRPLLVLFAPQSFQEVTPQFSLFVLLLFRMSGYEFFCEVSSFTQRAKTVKCKIPTIQKKAPTRLEVYTLRGLERLK
jgi:hypothetical protein